jgi:hypothetical protein
MCLASLLRTTTGDKPLLNITHELKFQIERGRSVTSTLSSFAVVVSLHSINSARLKQFETFQKNVVLELFQYYRCRYPFDSSNIFYVTFIFINFTEQNFNCFTPLRSDILREQIVLDTWLDQCAPALI